MDDKARQSFLEMPIDEQLIAILSSLEYVRGEMAKVKQQQIKFEQEIKDYRTLREIGERNQTQEIISGVVEALKEQGGE